MSFAPLRIAVACFAAFTATLPGAATAGDDPVVVELFTSQGCSACPPADELLGELVNRDDVLPLALHVDYWDYLGWKDRFANAAYSERQKGYARRAHRRTVYTPEMIVEGETALMGTKPMHLADLIGKHADKPEEVDLQVRRDGARLVISLRSLTEDLPRCDIHVVTYIPNETVAIERGENAGKEISYSHIVRDWKVVGGWDGESEIELTAEAAADHPVAVLVQGEGFGPIFAAARLR